MESLREGGMAATPFLLSLNGYAIYYCFEWGPEGRANTQHGVRNFLYIFLDLECGRMAHLN